MSEAQARLGWICPKCGRALSPDITSCPFCVGERFYPIPSPSDNTPSSPWVIDPGWTDPYKKHLGDEILT